VIQLGSKITSVSVARARVIRADGTIEVHYSAEAVPFWQLRRRRKLRRHLRTLREEDRAWLRSMSG
jgi:hypothetical protein